MSLIDDSMMFIRVAEAGSFTQAALNLESSKSKLSRKIANLEQKLNAVLFLRTARGLKLTPQGETFYQSCLAIESQFESAKDTLKDNQETISGDIALTAPMSLGSLYLGPILAQFMSAHPDITLELSLSDKAVSLTESHFDVAIRAASQLQDSNLKARQLFSYDYAIVASKEYLLKHGTPLTPQDLIHHQAITCITTSKESLQGHWPFTIDGKVAEVPLKRVARVTHMWVQTQFAKSGAGFIRVPRYWVRESLEEGTLIEVLADYDKGHSRLYALHKYQTNTPRRITALLDYLHDHLPGVLS